MTKILAFAGKKQSGKTTSATYVQSLHKQYCEGNCGIYNFADPLKQQICMKILGLTYDQCYGSDNKKNELVDCYWNDHQLSAREVMQILGTDIFRKMKQNVWSNATIRQILEDKPKLAIIADCRFPNEVDTVKKAGGLVIKLDRDLYHSDHASELALDPKYYPYNNFDLVIDNNNLSISEQQDIIVDFLSYKGILPL
jgi:hypothetical protein